MNLRDAKAVVTGGLSGLGLGVVKHLLAGGVRVAVLDVLAAVPDELPPDVLYFSADVSVEDEVDHALAEVAERFGGLTLAVSCAGVAHAGKLLGRERVHSQGDFARVLAVNLIGTFNVAKAAANLMRNNPSTLDGERGVIINTGSIAADEGQVGLAAYAASKGGVASLTLPLARELAAYGIRVVTIAPGLFETPMMAAMSDTVRARLNESLAFPERFGRAEEFAGLVAHVYGNPMLNGSVVRLDGALRLPNQRRR
ncbi:MAG: SDR family NAD(P)-dependent oxidoreductase [Gammaproteobacteria bacterium]